MILKPMFGRVGLSMVLIFYWLMVKATMAGGTADYDKARKFFENGNHAEAAVWLEKAVKQGHSVARLPLAAMYREGLGVEQDLGRAVELFTISAEEGYPSAQFTLGALYRAGEGVETDYSMAFKWFQKAARQGEVDSQNNLGTMFEAGRGVRSNQVTALMWYEVAANNGSRRAGDNYKRLKRKLSPDLLLQAKKLVLACMQSSFRNCGPE